METDSPNSMPHPQALDYHGGREQSPAPGRLAIASFVCALVGNPWWLALTSTRPFWTGHPLTQIAWIINLLPLLSILSIMLGVVAIQTSDENDGQFRQKPVAIAGIAISIFWWVMCGGMLIYVMAFVEMPTPS